ncbi:MAG TPA: carbamoyltransferase C-terminal domain-containing protein [Tepidisphaeraceae bacterium]|nr:carbamoyltransferase C-terminal domain-containing protein [Tepidisphaeraceae bacterium]
MTVLAIHDGHDSGVCLLRDGKVVYAFSEERRRNIKNYPGVPELSIAAALKRSGTTPADIDLIAISGRLRTRAISGQRANSWRFIHFGYKLARSDWATAVGQKILARMAKREELHDYLRKIGLGDKPIRTYDHHRCHAATAFFHRPWSEESLVLTLDGAGDGLCATVSVGRGNEMKLVSSTPKYHSMPANLYSLITWHLGLKPFEHEYKVMGMAPYGQAEQVAALLRPLFSVEGMAFRNHTGKVGDHLMPFYEKLLARQRFDNISAGLQLVFEEMMLKWIKNCVAATGQHRIVCAGGAFLNVKANMLIRQLPEVETFFAYPASDDGGTPVGAAILGYLDLCSERGISPELKPSPHMYLGLDFAEREMETAIQASGLPYQRLDDPAGRVAAMLAEGNIVARFDGQEELGPRALGNRTIMADPRDLRNIRKLNFAIKYRDFWMPFAASILEEDADRYIKDRRGWPYYMIEAFQTTPAAEKEIIAGMHPMDNTVRPQIVNQLNPAYGQIIREFKKLTGVGGILNTSFNLHGFPIVGSPEIALDTLVKSQLDALLLGPFLVTKKP